MSRNAFFWGYPVSEALQAKLNEQPPAVLDFFFQNSGEYLTRVKHGGVSYIGKTVAVPVELDSLDLLEVHVRSLLRRLSVEDIITADSLVLFPICEDLVNVK